MDRLIRWQQVYEIDEASFGKFLWFFGTDRSEQIQEIKDALTKIEKTKTGQELFAQLMSQNKKDKITIKYNDVTGYLRDSKAILIDTDTFKQGMTYSTREPQGQDQLAFFHVDDILFHESIHDLQIETGHTHGVTTIHAGNEKEAVRKTNAYKREVGYPERNRYRDTLRTLLDNPNGVALTGHTLETRLFAENVVDEGINPEIAADLANNQARQLDSIVQKIRESGIDVRFDWAAAIPRDMDVSDLDRVARLIDQIISRQKPDKNQR